MPIEADRMTTAALARPLFDPPLVRQAVKDSFLKLAPWVQWRNPVMFVVFVGSVLITGLWIIQLGGGLAQEGRPGFVLAVALWLWATLLFANFAESLAEGRGKAQAAALRSSRRDVVARRFPSGRTDQPYASVASSALRRGDVVLVEAGDTIPGDGEVIRGTASVDESAITGESAPVIREAGGDRSAVSGGTKLLSDKLHIRISANPGEAFLDRMIAMVENAKRSRTPNEIALAILLAGLTLIFLKTTATLLPFSIYSVTTAGHGSPISITVLVALLVCLIPTTIGGLLSAIGIAGMDRMIQANVIATSGRAVEAAGDIDVLLLDKTGTITLGNRLASRFIPAPGVGMEELADAAQLASLADETPEGRSIVALARQQHGIQRPRRALHPLHRADAHERGRFRGRPDPQGRHRCHRAMAQGAGRWVAAGSSARGRQHRSPGRDAAGRRRGRARAGCDRAQGHRQGRHPRTLRGTAPHGHLDRHDHRRQQADRRGDRGRSGCR
jgi:K+-transporting ATPase ATPase B chain